MFEKLAEIIVEYVDIDKESIKPETRFMEDMGFTSFDFMSMMGQIEDTFDVEVDPQEASKIVTMQDAVDYLSGLQ